MKPLIVYVADGKWFGSEVEWARSGSGFYRQITGVAVPQTQDAIKAFARENGYSIEWRGPIPDEPEPAAVIPRHEPA
jgi:hypothetical protein